LDKTLSSGSSGENVVLLQKMLVSKGYLVMPKGVSYGYFGNLTETAINKFKDASGLGNYGQYEGVVGNQTWSVLGLDAADKSSDTRSSMLSSWNPTAPAAPKVATPVATSGKSTNTVNNTTTYILPSTPTSQSDAAKMNVSKGLGNASLTQTNSSPYTDALKRSTSAWSKALDPFSWYGEGWERKKELGILLGSVLIPELAPEAEEIDETIIANEEANIEA
jgi:hypothetical protein